MVFLKGRVAFSDAIMSWSHYSVIKSNSTCTTQLVSFIIFEWLFPIHCIVSKKEKEFYGLILCSSLHCVWYSAKLFDELQPVNAQFDPSMFESWQGKEKTYINHIKT